MNNLTVMKAPSPLESTVEVADLASREQRAKELTWDGEIKCNINKEKAIDK